MTKFKTLPMTGNQAIAEAMRQVNPDVVAAYPITPQSAIVETFSKFVADGKVDTEMVRVESEHSALSAVVGASLTGARAMTATCSAGLALMWEIVGVASGLRCPIVMAVANRALSAPINIHCDHSDSMGARDLSWIQIYCENAQEAYEMILLALRLAEHPDVMLPVMVCEDGFITSHCVQNVKIHDDSDVRKFVGGRRSEHNLFDFRHPVTIGAIELQDYYFESKRQQQKAMKNALKVYLETGKELSKLTGNDYGYFEKYRIDGAEAIIITMSSSAGTAKTVVDRMRNEGKKVGLLKIRLFRPFPYEEVKEAVKSVKAIGVLDRSFSFGANAPLFSEVKNALFGLEKRPKVQSYVFGLGGRDLLEEHVEHAFKELLEGKLTGKEKYLGLRE